MDKEHNDYVSIPLDHDETEKLLGPFRSEQVVDHVYTKISMVYSDITLDYIRSYLDELKDKLGMHFPVDYIEESYTKFEASVDTGFYYYGYHLSQTSPVYRVIKGEIDVFLVDKKADFIFTYLFDIITIVLHYDNEEQVKHAIKLADNRFDERVKSHKLCRDPDCNKSGVISIDDDDSNNGSLCSLCWIIYTRMDSEFYSKCMNTIQSTKLINFTSSAYESLEIEHKLFTNVLFLCGNSILPESRDNNNNYAKYSGINKWVSLPLWFYLLLGEKTTTNKLL